MTLATLTCRCGYNIQNIFLHKICENNVSDIKRMLPHSLYFHLYNLNIKDFLLLNTGKIFRVQLYVVYTSTMNIMYGHILLRIECDESLCLIL